MAFVFFVSCHIPPGGNHRLGRNFPINGASLFVIIFNLELCAEYYRTEQSRQERIAGVIAVNRTHVCARTGAAAVNQQSSNPSAASTGKQ